MVLSKGTTEKIPSDTTGNRSRLVEQSLNHYATSGPSFTNKVDKTFLAMASNISLPTLKKSFSTQFN